MFTLRAKALAVLLPSLAATFPISVDNLSTGRDLNDIFYTTNNGQQQQKQEQQQRQLAIPIHEMHNCCLPAAATKTTTATCRTIEDTTTVIT